MKQNIRLRYQSSLWSKFLDGNPQLFREIQGKLNTRNVVIAAAISVIIQFITVMFLLGKLPDMDTKVQCGRYGMALIYNVYREQVCYAQNDLGDWVINWQLWWLDLFLILSFLSIFALLVVGTYMLVADLVREEERGTLNFIRLTPQSAGSILSGKILGVPILLYTAVVLFLPLHLLAGFQAHIPLTLILAFDATVVASCAFFYCLSLLWSSIEIGVPGLKSWLASGLLGFALLIGSFALFDGYLEINHLSASLLLFHPGMVLTYLIEATNLPQDTIYFLSQDNLAELSFYGQTLWTKAPVGIGLILLNFGLWTYWCWSVLKRRFHNPEQTLLSKTHSYWLTSWFVIVALGFTLQKDYPDLGSIEHITDNFVFLQFCLGIFGLGLIVALSPQRQTLHDWARYRHQVNQGSLWKDLILGENSPSLVAIAINLAIAITFITPSIFLILPQSQHHILWGFVLCASNILLCAVTVQFILTIKNRQRAVWAIVTLGIIIIIPPLCLGVADLTMKTLPQAWLFSFVPTAAVEYATLPAIAFAALGQWLAIAVISLQMTRKLKQAGASETKILLDRQAVLSD